MITTMLSLQQLQSEWMECFAPEVSPGGLQVAWKAGGQLAPVHPALLLNVLQPAVVPPSPPEQLLGAVALLQQP